MDEQPFARLKACLGDLPDRRVQGRGDHKLIDIFLPAVCAVLCEAESWGEVEAVGQANGAGLK
jgi:hypothetical protein